ncbi:MAG: recombinase family protein [Melioribacteraceae bacterium]|nr:recombinase family protein [Melioribacteraceae bacterium]
MLHSNYTGWRMPYGYTAKDKKPFVNPKEAKIVKHIFDLALSGKSKRDILYELNNKKIPSQTGKEWSAGTLVYLFKKDKIMFYAGYINEEKDNHEPIIDLATAKKLIAQLSAKTLRPHRKDYLLSNLDVLHCGYCSGKAKSASLPIGDNKVMREYYLCTTRQMYGAGSGKCNNSKTVPQKAVNDLVLTDLTIHAGNNNLEKYLALYSKKVKMEVDTKSKTINRRIDSLMEKQYTVTSKKDLTETAEQLNELMQQRQVILSPFAKIVSVNDIKLAKKIKSLPLTGQRELIQKLIYRIELFSDKVIVHYNFGISANGNNKVELRINNGKLVSKKK